MWKTRQKCRSFSGHGFPVFPMVFPPPNVYPKVPEIKNCPSHYIYIYILDSITPYHHQLDRGFPSRDPAVGFLKIIRKIQLPRSLRLAMRQVSLASQIRGENGGFTSENGGFSTEMGV
jgi:hypothetical protein